MAKKSRIERLISLDEQPDGDWLDAAFDIGAGFTPLQYPQAARDFERSRRESDALGMGLAGLATIPVVGGISRIARNLKKVKQVKESPEITNLLYHEKIGGNNYVPGDVLPKWGIRNITQAELDDIIKKGFMMSGGANQLKGRNSKYFTMTDTPKATGGISKPTIRVASENLPFDRAVRAEHVEIYDPNIKDWIPLLGLPKARKKAGGNVEKVYVDRKMI